MFEKFWAIKKMPPARFANASYYTSKVHPRGVMKNQGFETHGGGFCLYSCDFQSPRLMAAIEKQQEY
jgi:hypothetical protein